MGKKISSDNSLGAFFMFSIAIAIDVVLSIILIVEKALIVELISFMVFFTVILGTTGTFTLSPAVRYQKCKKHGKCITATVVDKLDEQGRRGRVFYITTAFSDDDNNTVKSTSQVSRQVYFKLFPGDVINVLRYHDYALVNEADLYPTSEVRL